MDVKTDRKWLVYSTVKDTENLITQRHREVVAMGRYVLGYKIKLPP